MVFVDVVGVVEDAVWREKAGRTALFEDGPVCPDWAAGGAAGGGVTASCAAVAVAVCSTFPGVELGVDGEGIVDYLRGFGPPVNEGVGVEVGLQLQNASGDAEDLDGGLVGGCGEAVAGVEPAAVGGWEGKVAGVEGIELCGCVSVLRNGRVSLE